jgi:hypothetical protein
MGESGASSQDAPAIETALVNINKMSNLAFLMVIEPFLQRRHELLEAVDGADDEVGVDFALYTILIPRVDFADTVVIAIYQEESLMILGGT